MLIQASNGVHISTTGPGGPWKAANATALKMGYEFGDCPAVAQLHNGSIVSWSQSLYADTPGGNSDQSYSNLQIASQWGDKFKTLRPTIVFPDEIWKGARKANMEIRLDDPTIWMDQRGYWVSP